MGLEVLQRLWNVRNETISEAVGHLCVVGRRPWLLAILACAFQVAPPCTILEGSAREEANCDGALHGVGHSCLLQPRSGF